MERVLRTRLVTALVLVLVFVAGAVAGVAWGQGNGSRHDTQARTARHQVFMQVHPTERQKTEIDSILRERGPAFRKLHQDFRKSLDQLRKTFEPRQDSLVKETIEAIKSVLTPAQAAQYDSLLARMRSRRATERRPRQGGE